MPRKPRLGRPPLRDAERRKHIMSIRVRPNLRAMLLEAAGMAGRTLSQEVEFRLEMSFTREFELTKDALDALKAHFGHLAKQATDVEPEDK
jgi:hypothetical protein